MENPAGRSLQVQWCTNLFTNPGDHQMGMSPNCSTPILRWLMMVDTKNRLKSVVHRVLMFDPFPGQGCFHSGHLQRVQSLLLGATSVGLERPAPLVLSRTRHFNKQTPSGFLWNSKSWWCIIPSSVFTCKKTAGKYSKRWWFIIPHSNCHCWGSISPPFSHCPASQWRMVHQWGEWLAAVIRKIEPKKKVAASVGGKGWGRSRENSDHWELFLRISDGILLGKPTIF